MGVGSTRPTSMKRRQVWQALTVSLLVTGYSGYYLCRSNLSVAMPLILDELVAQGWTREVATVRLGSLVSVGTLAYALGKFVSGMLADRFGGRTNFLGGMLGSVVMTVLFALGGGFPLFTTAWILNRFVQSLGWVGMVKLTSRWFSYSSYGAAMGVISLSYLFGDALARRFMGDLINAGYGWRGVFAIAAGTLGSIFLVALALLRESPAAIGEAEGEASPHALAVPFEEHASDGWRASLRPLLRHPTFLSICLLSLALTIVRETFNTWTPTYFRDGLGYTAAAAANASAWFPLAGGISVLLAGYASDRLGGRGRAIIITFGLATATVALLLLGSTEAAGLAVSPVLLVATIAFLLLGPYSYLAGAIALDLGGKRSAASAAGFIDGVGYLGGMLAGDTMARIGVGFGWQGVFRTLALLTAAGAVAGGFYLRSVNEAAPSSPPH